MSATTATTKKLKIAIVTCYDQNDFVRARTLRTAFAAAPGVDAIVLKNKYKGLLRYLEVPLKLLLMRFRDRPDAYVVTFRGYEMLLYMLLTGVRKPIIFDEMINFVEYFEEHGKLKPGTGPDNFFRKFYAWQLKRCRIVLADTQAHAEFSAQLCNVDIDRFRVIPIGTDETVFYPRKHQPGRADHSFNVFYYGNGMTPLHGLQHVLDAAMLLKDNPRITFTLIGGHEKAEKACADAVSKGAHVTYTPWVPFEELPQLATDAGLCLGGPFGKTMQSQFVVTGKAMQFLALGQPVLVGKNEVSGMFKHQENCLLVPLANPQAIASTISWAETHPEELKKIGRAGRALYEAHFSQTIINRLVGDIVKELA